jgi:hypothetical protein
MAMNPAALTASLLAGESSWMAACGERMLRKSQTLTVLSSEPDTALSSFSSTADVTGLRKRNIALSQVLF